MYHMRIFPIISFRVIYAIFHEYLSQDLSACHTCAFLRLYHLALI